MRVVRRRLTIRILLLALVFGTLLFAALNFHRPALLWSAYCVLVFSLFGVGLPYWIFRSGETQWAWTSQDYVFAGHAISISGQWAGSGGVPHIRWSTPGVQGFPYEWLAQHPGLLELPAFRGETGYPVGLVRTGIELPGHPAVWVYPTPIDHMGHSYVRPAPQEGTQALRQYQPGDRRNRILLKTQALPASQWITRDQEGTSDSEPSIVLSWFDLPEDWTSHKKLEQLAYAVQEVPSKKIFKLTLPNMTTSEGVGSAHQHLAWRHLSTIWQSLEA